MLNIPSTQKQGASRKKENNQETGKNALHKGHRDTQRAPHRPPQDFQRAFPPMLTPGFETQSCQDQTCWKKFCFGIGKL